MSSQHAFAGAFADHAKVYAVRIDEKLHELASRLESEASP